jgi:acyl carrier protein
MSDQTTDKIIEIIADQAMLDPSEVTRESSPESLGLDSLGIVEIVFAIEETFDVSVPFNANEPDKSGFDISSVGKIVDAVKTLIAEQS